MSADFEIIPRLDQGRVVDFDVKHLNPGFYRDMQQNLEGARRLDADALGASAPFHSAGDTGA